MNQYKNEEKQALLQQSKADRTMVVKLPRKGAIECMKNILGNRLKRSEMYGSNRIKLVGQRSNNLEVWFINTSEEAALRDMLICYGYSIDE